jgi:hypothetical protein
MARRPASRRLSAALMALTLAVIVPWPAAAYETDGLLIYLDATNPASAPGATTTWTDLSGNARHGTFAGAGPATVTFDAANQAVVFPGGTNGTAYVALAGDFADFSGGFAIEFEAEFGVSRTAWERVFDFAFAVGATADAFWVGQLAATNELTIEVWTDGAQSGYCHSATDGTALGAAGERQFQRWMITIGQDAPYLCRMYRDGIEIPTRVSPWPVNISSVGANANGSAFVLPPNTARPSGFVGRSNFIADRDLEGAIRYLRIYNRELTPVQAQANASRTVTFAANDGSGRTSTQSSIAPVALDANTFTRAGHEFLGWNREPDGSGTAYADLDVFPFVADVTLHAIWEAVAPEVPEAPGEGDGDDDAGAPPRAHRRTAAARTAAARGRRSGRASRRACRREAGRSPSCRSPSACSSPRSARSCSSPGARAASQRRGRLLRRRGTSRAAGAGPVRGSRASTSSSPASPTSGAASSGRAETAASDGGPEPSVRPRGARRRDVPHGAPLRLSDHGRLPLSGFFPTWWRALGHTDPTPTSGHGATASGTR